MSWHAGNRYLTAAETFDNAQEVADFFIVSGWTRNAIAAMLGNMQGESGINPGIWEGLIPYGGGYGLTQWTPYTKLSTWAEAEGETWIDNGPTQCQRIDYEQIHNVQWFYNSEIGMDPPITFHQFTESMLPINTLTNYFLWFYEHPADPGPTTQATRQGYAAYWDQNLDWTGAKTFPVWLLFKFNKRRCL